MPVFQRVPRALRGGRAQARGRRRQIRQRAVRKVPVVLLRVPVARELHLLPVSTQHGDSVASFAFTVRVLPLSRWMLFPSRVRG